MFIFQSSSSVASTAVSQKEVADLISSQQSFMLGAATAKPTAEQVSRSIGAVFNFYDMLGKSGAAPGQKKEFFSFFDSYSQWAAKALQACAGELGKDQAGILAGLLSAIPYDKNADIDPARRLYYSNFSSVIGMCADASSGGKQVSLVQADMFADFLTKMAGQSMMNYYQCRLLVDGMIEAASGLSAPDNWVFKFASQQDADSFVKILSALPGFKAVNIGQEDLSVSFSLQALPKGASSEFQLPSGLAAGKPKKMQDGGFRKAVFSKSSFQKKVEAGQEYETDIDRAFAAQADNLASSSQVHKSSLASGAVLYGQDFKTDRGVSQVSTDDATSLSILDLAHSLGFHISLPMEQWFAGEEGQACLKLMKGLGIKMNIMGSADMPVFYDAKKDNGAELAKFADRDFSLAKKERSELPIEFFNSLNEKIQAEAQKIGLDPKKLALFDVGSATPRGKLHFFQDSIPEDMKAKYGYTEGEGAKNLTAVMAYLKNVSALAPENGMASMEVGRTKYFFTPEDISQAGAYYQKLMKGAVVQNKDGTYAPGDISQLNTYFRRMPGDRTLRGLGGTVGGMINEGAKNVFARALMESTEISSRSVTLLSDLDASLTVKIEEFGSGKAVFSVDYAFKNPAGEFVPVSFNKNSGQPLLVYFKGKGGAIVPLTATQRADGKFEVQDALLSGEGRIAARAQTSDGGLDSGFVWQTIELQKPVVQINRITAGGEVAPQYTGRYMPLPFQAYSQTKIEAVAGEGGSITQQPINSMLCFGMNSSDKKYNFAPKYLLYPGEVKIKKDALTYQLDGEYVIVDRDLYYRGPSYKETGKYELYMKQSELEKSANSGVVAIFVQPASGEGVWVKLDGSLVSDDSLNSLKRLPENAGATDALFGPEKTAANKTAVSFLGNPNSALRAGSTEAVENPNMVSNPLGSGGMYQPSHLPNAMVVESKSDLWLARQHIIAKVEVDPSEPGKAYVWQLDGNEIGEIDISTTEKPDSAGKTRAEKKVANDAWDKANNLKIAAQIGALQGGIFLFKAREENDYFTYPTYVPRVDNISKVTGYIYSMKDFFDSRGVKGDE